MSVVAVAGRLDPSAGPRLRDDLLRIASEADRALILDLDRLQVDRSSPLAGLVAVWSRVAVWPGIPVVLVAAEPALRLVLRARAVSKLVPTVESMDQAVSYVSAVARRRREQIHLACDRFSPRRSRLWIRAQLTEWGVDDPAPAELVSTELVDNAIIHARSPSVLRADLRQGALSIAVLDDDPRPPRLVPIGERMDGGRGLVIVDQLTRAWGSSPRPGGGKIVWAVLSRPE